jgi:hypothetical protein
MIDATRTEELNVACTTLVFVDSHEATIINLYCFFLGGEGVDVGSTAYPKRITLQATIIVPSTSPARVTAVPAMQDVGSADLAATAMAVLAL